MRGDPKQATYALCKNLVEIYQQFQISSTVKIYFEVAANIQRHYPFELPTFVMERKYFVLIDLLWCSYFNFYTPFYMCF